MSPRLPHYNTVFNYLENPELTPDPEAPDRREHQAAQGRRGRLRRGLIRLHVVRFVRWFDHKYGVAEQEHDWVKVSLMTGVKTNVVTAVEVDERYAGDCPSSPPLVKATAENFTLREVSADTPISATRTWTPVAAARRDAVHRVQGEHDGGRAAGVFAKMFHFYSLNRDDFLSPLSQAEQRRIDVLDDQGEVRGPRSAPRPTSAMVNEALGKILCHNICCLIQCIRAGGQPGVLG